MSDDDDSKVTLTKAELRQMLEEAKDSGGKQPIVVNVDANSNATAGAGAGAKANSGGGFLRAVGAVVVVLVVLSLLGTCM